MGSLRDLGVDVEQARCWNPDQQGDLLHSFGCSPSLVTMAHQAGVRMVLTHDCRWQRARNGAIRRHSSDPVLARHVWSAAVPEKVPMKASKSATLYSRLLTSARLTRIRSVSRLLYLIRRVWLRFADPAIAYSLDGVEISLPLSHDLPSIRRNFPDYSENLGRLAALGAARDGNFSVVDIGANVGDSAAIVRSCCDVPILCIEGDETFIPYLRANVARWNTVEVAPVYVRSSAFDGGGLTVQRVGGTASLTTGEEELPSQTLAEILARHDRFTAPQLVKIDTDGHDVGIIDSSLSLLASIKPVLFFEFDPALTTEVTGDDAHRVFEELRQIGYSRALFFSNTGELLLALDSVAWPEIPTLAKYASPQDSVGYFDVCVFGTSDLEFAHTFEATEVMHREAMRNPS